MKSECIFVHIAALLGLAHSRASACVLSRVPRCLTVVFAHTTGLCLLVLSCSFLLPRKSHSLWLRWPKAEAAGSFGGCVPCGILGLAQILSHSADLESLAAVRSLGKSML
eukprot:1812368-Pleurochrysis_carterae.AAC.1